MINRRGFLAGLAGLVAAPAIIRTIDLMPVKPIKKVSWLKPGIYLREFEEFNAIDGVVVYPGHKFLLTNQSKAEDNGVWVVLDDFGLSKYSETRAAMDARQSSFKDYSQKLDAKLRAGLEKPERISQVISRPIL